MERGPLFIAFSTCAFYVMQNDDISGEYKCSSFQTTTPNNCRMTIAGRFVGVFGWYIPVYDFSQPINVQVSTSAYLVAKHGTVLRNNSKL